MGNMCALCVQYGEVVLATCRGGGASHMGVRLRFYFQCCQLI